MEQINIELVPSGVMSTAHASQFDIGRGIRFNLKDGGTPYTLAGTETITIEMVKPDGSEQTISLTNTSSTYVDWTTADGELDLDGVYSAEISIVQGDDVLGTKNFLVRVEPDPYNGKGLRVVTVGPADICTFEPTISEPLVNVKCELPPSLDGYSAVNLTACGVNLISSLIDDGKVPSISDGSLVTSAGSRSNYIKVKSSTDYSFIVETAQGLYMFYYDENKTYISYDSVDNSTYMTKTTPVNCRYVMLRTAIDNLTVGTFAEGTHTQLIPYTGNAYAIALGDTYYGGTLDVTTGVLTVNYGKVTASANDTIAGALHTPNNGWAFTIYNKDAIYMYNGNVISNINTVTTYNQATESGFCKAITSLKPLFFLADSDTGLDASATLEQIQNAFEIFCNNNNPVAAYELATPVVIDLGSGTAVTARANEVNNVFADCGQTELKYLTIEV